MGGLRRFKKRGKIDRHTVEALQNGLEPRAWKLSTRIVEIAKPLLDSADPDQFEVIVSLAAVCWNIALLPEDQQERELRSLAKKMTRGESAEFRRDVENWARILIDRKKTLFREDRRAAADLQISAEGDSRNLFVTSTLVPD